ncbi:MAG: type I restriction enzyme HsdR N-terminal domain-containing protein [Desulfovermiculus sp.]|nr:type I restriction enzyme HsdR N-terminal domain-containing protein [Desulfovermiculus sp.]
MHELNLGYTVQDYISGKEIEATTYEDVRQDMARFLVEDKGVPKEALQSKVQVTAFIDTRPYVQQVDIVIGRNGQAPMMALKFCAGQVETYTRQLLAAARLLPQGPAALAAVTDSKKALILQVADGTLLQECSYHEFPDWQEMQDLVQTVPAYQLTPDRKNKEGRLLYALSELSCSCSQESCSVPGGPDSQ